MIADSTSEWLPFFCRENFQPSASKTFSHGADTIRAFLFQVEPFDPLVTGGVAVTIVVLALVASLRPAFAATRLDLARVLRGD